MFVDFKAVKAAVSMEQLLDHYGVKLKRSGKELHGRCPIHKGHKGYGTNSFHVNIERNVFHCSSCGAKGNVLDFVAVMENCTVLELKDRFPAAARVSASVVRSSPLGVGKTPAGELNSPLGFQLQAIDHSHPYLTQRGIDPATAAYFGVGFFAGKGLMSGRVVIPIHNERGELLAYAGRAIDGSEPRYKLPVEFKKSQVLFNYHRARRQMQDVLYVVEGFFDCLRVHQAGFPCVALMGNTLSEEQEHLLLQTGASIALMLNDTDAGRSGMYDCINRLVLSTFVTAILLPEGSQPDELSEVEIRELLEGEYYQDPRRLLKYTSRSIKAARYKQAETVRWLQ